MKGARFPGVLAFVSAAWLGAATASIAASPSISKTTWRGFAAYELTDGRTKAVAVPELGGRVVFYGRIDGPNFLWVGEPGLEREADALMWGGDKAYIGPHTMWHFTQPTMWPPPSPNTAPQEVTVTGATLRMVSPPWPGYGVRLIREIAYDPSGSGELVFKHTVEKAAADNATLAAVWTITQAAPGDVYIPLNPQSPYKGNAFWFGSGIDPQRLGATALSDSLLRIRPVSGAGFKLGSSPGKPALLSIKAGVAFLERADPQDGQYPEGADNAGLSVEVYHHDLPAPKEYVELEFLSPLRRIDQGATLTTRWSLQDLPKDADLATAAGALLNR